MKSGGTSLSSNECNFAACKKAQQKKMDISVCTRFAVRIGRL